MFKLWLHPQSSPQTLKASSDATWKCITKVLSQGWLITQSNGVDGVEDGQVSIYSSFSMNIELKVDHNYKTTITTITITISVN